MNGENWNYQEWLKRVRDREGKKSRPDPAGNYRNEEAVDAEAIRHLAEATPLKTNKM